MIAVQKFEQLLDLGCAETANVVAFVKVSWRGANKNQVAKQLRCGAHGQHADHGTNRMPDKDYLVQGKLVEDLNDIIGVALKTPIFFW